MDEELHSQLIKRLERLTQQQQQLNNELASLKRDLQSIQLNDSKEVPKIIAIQELQSSSILGTENSESTEKANENTSDANPNKINPVKRNLEVFIGGNLSAKAGILALISGIGVSISYALERNLLGAGTRIVLSVLVGILMIGLAFKFLKKYRQFSAVLFSGGMAILYMSLFLSYSMYGFIPLWLAFLLMITLTTCTALAANWQKNEVIGLYGFVGAYAIPLLLGIHEKPNFIFPLYVLILNIGVLVLSYKNYWKIMYYSAFAVTWTMFTIWYLSFSLLFGFWSPMVLLTTYFLVFYGMFMLYKVRQFKIFGIGDVAILLFNSLIFFALGFFMLKNSNFKNALGVFTLANSFIHGLAAWLIYRKAKTDKTIYQFSIGLFITFLVIAVPVQLSGKWISLTWMGEFCVLYFISTRNDKALYFKLSIAMGVLAAISIIALWLQSYKPYNFPNYSGIPVILNGTFLVSVLIFIALGYFTFYHKPLSQNTRTFPQWLFVVACMVVGYFLVRFEIVNYFSLKYTEFNNLQGMPANGSGEKYIYLKSVWTYTFSAVYLFAAWLIYKNIQNKKGFFIPVSIVFMLFYFVFTLSALNHLHEIELTGVTSLRYIRYLPAASFLLFLTVFYFDIKQNELKILFHIFLIALLSAEWYFFITHTVNMPLWTFVTRIGLSTIWAVYSILLIAKGIRSNQKYLRVMGIALLGISLVKIVLFDLSHLEAIGKAMLLILIGIMLLLASFLYQKHNQVTGKPE